MNILEVAEHWGLPPWEVARTLTDTARARWYHRQVAWDHACEKRQAIEGKKAQHKAEMKARRHG